MLSLRVQYDKGGFVINSQEFEFKVSLPSADSDKAFNGAVRKLISKAEEYGKKDNRRMVVVVVDLVYSLRDARASAMHEGLHGPTVDKVLMKVIESYIYQIESEWS